MKESLISSPNVVSGEEIGIDQEQRCRCRDGHPDLDAIGRFKALSNTGVGGAALVSTVYGFNNANQRTTATREDTTYWHYDYDNVGQVTGGSHRLASSTLINGEQFSYTFDRIGNRTSTTVNGQGATYTPNLLNQYSQRTVPGVLDVSGEASSDTTVTVSRPSKARVSSSNSP